MGMTARMQLFVEEYLNCFVGSEAARRAGYTGRPDAVAARLLARADVQAQISRRISERAITADEVLLRLAEQARATFADFVSFVERPDEEGKTQTVPVLDLVKARDAGKLHLVKKATSTRQGLTIELYDAQAALVQLGRYHRLFAERVDVVDWAALSDEQLERIIAGENPADVLAGNRGQNRTADPGSG